MSNPLVKQANRLDAHRHQTHKIIQAGKVHKSFLIQTIAHKKTNADFRLDCSELHSVRSWKHSKMENAQSLCTAYATVQLSSWETVFLHKQAELLLFMSTTSCPPTSPYSGQLRFFSLMISLWPLEYAVSSIQLYMNTYFLYIYRNHFDLNE